MYNELELWKAIEKIYLQWASAKYPDDLTNRYQRDRVDVRVYDLTGSGYYFIRGVGPGKWYRQDDATDDHFCNCQLSEVQQSIDAGGRVQIVGDRGKSFGVWNAWEEFEGEVLK